MTRDPSLQLGTKKKRKPDVIHFFFSHARSPRLTKQTVIRPKDDENLRSPTKFSVLFLPLFSFRALPTTLSDDRRKKKKKKNHLVFSPSARARRGSSLGVASFLRLGDRRSLTKQKKRQQSNRLIITRRPYPPYISFTYGLIYIHQKKAGEFKEVDPPVRRQFPLEWQTEAEIKTCMYTGSACTTCSQEKWNIGHGEREGGFEPRWTHTEYNPVVGAPKKTHPTVSNGFIYPSG